MKFTVDAYRKAGSALPVHSGLASNKGAAVFLIVILLAVLIALVAFGALPRVFKSYNLAQRTQEQMLQAPSVSVAVAQASSAIQDFTLPGTTQAIQYAPVYARVNGYLTKRYADIGDWVRTGQMLAEIDTPEIDQQVAAAQSAVQQAIARVDDSRQTLKQAEANALTAAANVQKAKTDLDFYTTEVKRYVWLAKTGAVSLEDSDSHTQQYNSGVATLKSLEATERSTIEGVNSAKASLRASEAALSVTRAQLRQLEATQSFKKVAAPFDGVVVKQNIDAGTLITLGSSSSNNVIFEVAKTDILRVYVYVPEQYISYVHADESVLLSFQAYPNKQFVGVVAKVAGGLDPNSKTLQVEIHVKNPDRKLMPGMYAQVRFQVPATVRWPIVPATTLQVRPDGGFVYVVDDQNRVHMKKPVIGRDLGAKFEITDGIAVGDKVIVNPSDNIRDGMLVRPVLPHR